MNRAIPNAPVLRYDEHFVTVGCPLCNARAHWHGSASLGHRLAHCWAPFDESGTGYVLVLADPTDAQTIKTWIWLIKKFGPPDGMTREAALKIDLAKWQRGEQDVRG